MKTIKFAALLLSMLIVISCDDDDVEADDFSFPFYQHMVWLSFQDLSGNDLLKGGEFIWTSEYGMRDEVKPEFYTLDVVFEDGIRNPWHSNSSSDIILDKNYPRLYLAEGLLAPPEYSADSNCGYLYFETGSYKYEWDTTGDNYWDAKFAEKITFSLICPYMFGDDEAHDIVTWWKPTGGIQTTCYRIEYNGKELSIEGPEDGSRATIILDR